MNAVARSRIAGRVEDLLNVRVRYVRSINIVRDRNDAQALQGYVATSTVADAMARLLKGLGKGSSQRAWRLTGPYGSGKSFFGLAVLTAVRKDKAAQEFRRGLCGDASQLKPLFEGLPSYLPVVVAGGRQDAAGLLASALADAFLQLPASTGRTTFLRKLAGFQTRRVAGKAPAMEVIALLREAAQLMQKGKTHDGILVLIDEMGLLVEYATDPKHKIDPNFFQLLAEAAGGKAEPRIAVLGLLHQRFEDYTLGTPGAVRAQEWAKVAERYEDIAFHEPLESTCQLLVRAMGVDRGALADHGVDAAAARLAVKAVDLGILRKTEALDPKTMVPELYPLHPSTLMALVAYFRRFGQNERSIFSFLTSSELSGLQDFAARNVPAAGAWYRLHHLCDYAIARGGLRTFEEERQKRWALLNECLRTATVMSSVELEILKIVGILNLLEPVTNLDASAESIAFARADDPADKETLETLAKLEERRILYRRGSSGEYCIWPQSSVDLTLELEKARKSVPVVTSFKPILDILPPPKPILAHRHYLKTGTLRAMSIKLLDPRDLDGETQALLTTKEDGQLVVVPVIAGREHDRITAKVKALSARSDKNVVYAVRRVSEEQLDLAHDLLCWRGVDKQCEELKVDPHAKREVRRTLDSITERILLELADIYSPGGDRGHTLFYSAGKGVSLKTGRELNRWVSELFDEVFNDAPIVRNEHINKIAIAKPAAMARQALVDAMLTEESKEFLGIEKNPPEKSIYLSMLMDSGMHRKLGKTGQWHFAAPSKNEDPNHWLPAWNALHDKLASGTRFTVDDLAKCFAASPWGLRKEVALLLILTYVLVNKSDVVIREKGSFVTALTDGHLARLARRPEHFDIHRVTASPALRGMLKAYTHALGDVGKTLDSEANVSLIVRALYEWFIALPDYTTQGAELTPKAKSLVTALSKSGDPIDLLLKEIPSALGHETEGTMSTSGIAAFKKSLLVGMGEVHGAHGALKTDLITYMATELDCDVTLPAVRKALTKLATAAGQAIQDYQLQAFVARTLEANREMDQWFLSTAQLMAGRPIDTWRKDQISQFKAEFKRLHEGLKRYVGLKVAVHKRGGEIHDYVGIHVVDGGGREKVFAVESAPMGADGTADAVRKVLSKTKNPEELLARLLVEFAQRTK